MMKCKYISACILLLLFAACSAKKKTLAEAMKDPGIRQEKEINKVKVVLSYMPACWQRNLDRGEADTSTMTFRVQVTPDKNSVRQTDNKAASFGTDSLFALVTGGDTIRPIYSERIANGNITGVEYVVAFERRLTGQSNALRFIYMDWLFSAARMEFFYERTNISKVDELSCSL
ncbi:hypothetical protein [uncultured Chitinophaga sp.]|uniref:hypothetical protein n=1 Tax=uncultured Chitinophaga sp. TaxID=339340 RepID=UPI0025FD48A4|nr:hypothetical protein [uncultured Chitinophaga sp.]